MEQPDYRGAIAYAFTRLTNELPSKLTYHNLWHTQEEVIPTCLQLAKAMGVLEADRQLLQVAAAFHDIGFIEDRANHELIGARIVAQTLPQFGFSHLQTETIMGMLLATRLPQSPRTLLEAILADADLDVLGRQDFMARNAALRQERANYGHPVPLQTWYAEQVVFMKAHSYFTAVAQTQRHRLKQHNISLLEQKVDSC
ncbi:MAG: HD domain-containing protein [Chloroflexota bacterium]